MIQIDYLTWVTAAGRVPDFSGFTPNFILKKFLVSLYEIHKKF